MNRFIFIFSFLLNIFDHKLHFWHISIRIIIMQLFKDVYFNFSYLPNNFGSRFIWLDITIFFSIWSTVTLLCDWTIPILVGWGTIGIGGSPCITSSVDEEFFLQLLLLDLGQWREFIYDIRIALQTDIAHYFSRFSISLCFCHFVVFFSHVHVSSCVSCILFTAVVEAWKLFLELLGASSNVFFSQTFLFWRPHFKVLDEVIHKVLSLFVTGNAR